MAKSRITREEAIRKGLKVFAGMPCKKCQELNRYVSTRGCVQCSRKQSNYFGSRIEANGKTYRANKLAAIFKRNRLWLVENFFSKGCHYCRLLKPISVMQVEHKIPVGNGYRISKNGIKYQSAHNRPGDITGLSSIETIKSKIKKYGLVPACADCNFVKRLTLDRGTPEGKRQWRAYLREVRKGIHKDTKRTQRRNQATAKRTGDRL
jgi:hypothetical protein